MKRAEAKALELKFYRTENRASTGIWLIGTQKALNALNALLFNRLRGSLKIPKNIRHLCANG